eukprot:GFUD01099736.1.p1 GENE.GFUD01099736.1~~GFUD01099736.1.p1  ORF type:complete len:171 (+),score=45.96 GFUD01099736.1:24-536(+)
MTALVIRSLNILLGIFFIFLGLLKLTPNIIRDLHKDLRAEYVKYAKVFPFAKSVGYRVPSKWYRRGVGGVEILCGLIMLVIPNRKIKKMANIVLLLTKLLNLYSHFAIDDLFERMAPTLVFFFMLVCRMVVDWQFDKSLAEKVEPEEVEGSYDKVDIRTPLPRQAKNKKE